MKAEIDKDWNLVVKPESIMEALLLGVWSERYDEYLNQDDITDYSNYAGILVLSKHWFEQEYLQPPPHSPGHPAE